VRLKRLAGDREQALCKADEMRDMLDCGDDMAWLAQHLEERDTLLIEYENLRDVAAQCDEEA